MTRLRSTFTRTLLLLSLTALAGLLLACSSSSDDGDSGSEATETATEAAGGDGEATGEMDLTVEMKDNVFEPTTFTVPVGTKVSFHYENTGQAVHNMVVRTKDVEGADFSSALAVNPGESGEFEGTFTKAGEYPFICSYHFPDMAGTITVE